MKIYKFGGASVKDADGVRNVTEIIKSQRSDHCLLVVSAMGKMTNAFEEVVHAYCFNTSKLTSAMDKIVKYHQTIIDELFTEEHIIFKKFDGLLQDLWVFLNHNKEEKMYDFSYDQIVCYGELLSTTILHYYLNLQGINTVWNDVRTLVKTDSSFRDARVNWEQTEAAISKKINSERLNIVQGFLGGDTKGNTTTLGREGSDYTAGIFAYCLNANQVTIWKDVRGVLNGDPKVFSKTQLLEQISYEETIEMAFYGASVVHPKTIQPLQSKNIPLFVRSFLDPSLTGTEVHRGVSIQPKIPCFIVKKNQILVSISTRDFSFMVEDNISHVFQLLHQYLLAVNLIQNSAISFSVCIDNKFNQFGAFYEELKSSYKVEVTKGVDLHTIRHFDRAAVTNIRSLGTSILTQVNKETMQIVIKI